MNEFRRLTENKWSEGKFVCVGLDPDVTKIPHQFRSTHLNPNGIKAFLQSIIDSTADSVCVFKPNSAFFEAFGGYAHEILSWTINYIKKQYPDVPVILDFKRGDIGNTNNGYIRLAFDDFGADAVTVSPYMGQESLDPFLARRDKEIFVLCRTSNSGAQEFQDLIIQDQESGWGVPLYQFVAKQIATRWNANGNCGLVVGATNPDEIGIIRRIIGDKLPILIPGIGAHGGDLEKSVRNGRNANKEGFIINVSRSVLFASEGNDFATKARSEVQRLNGQIRDCLFK